MKALLDTHAFIWWVTDDSQLSSTARSIIADPRNILFLSAASVWEIAIDMGDGILLKPKKPFLKTTLADVAGCLKYQGTPKTLEEMDDAIRQGIEESWHGGKVVGARDNWTSRSGCDRLFHL